MAYSLSEVVEQSGVPVDTIRYYQTIRLLPGPARDGRNAVYDDAHLDRLRLIRSMAGRGLSLKVIAMLLAKGERAESDRALLTAIEEESAEPGYDSASAARQLGIPHALLASVERAGLAEAQEQGDGSKRYSEGDLRVARGALKILAYGFPLTRLLALAVKHDRSIRKTVDGAIDLFDAYVRKRSRTRGAEADADAVTAAFKEILPLVTGLVAHHFQRVLVNRALKRLKKSGDEAPLAVALKVASETRLGIRWQ
jgi:DNA-binding transcriptional MerR regulator